MVEFTGGCLCGAIRYQVSGDLVRMAMCHCDDCRRATGSSFATNVFVKEEDLEILQGSPKAFEHPADSGNTMTKEFCGDCGSQLFGHNSTGTGVKALKVGCIDDASFVAPQAEVYISSALPFTNHLSETKKFDRGFGG
jgi:hypothetical protein